MNSCYKWTVVGLKCISDSLKENLLWNPLLLDCWDFKKRGNDSINCMFEPWKVMLVIITCLLCYYLEIMLIIFFKKTNFAISDQQANAPAIAKGCFLFRRLSEIRKSVSALTTTDLSWKCHINVTNLLLISAPDLIFQSWSNAGRNGIVPVCDVQTRPRCLRCSCTGECTSVTCWPVRCAHDTWFLQARNHVWSNKQDTHSWLPMIS